jgi:hypothetical protein
MVGVVEGATKDAEAVATMEGAGVETVAPTTTLLGLTLPPTATRTTPTVEATRSKGASFASSRGTR